MRIALNVLCGFTGAACLWLSAMFLVLHRPGFERGFAMSLLFVAQSLLTLAVVNHRVFARAWRILVAAGAAGIVWSGGNAIADTLNSQHFEGFVLLIGAALVLQGLLTGQDLITAHFASSSKVHQFGN